MLDGRPMQARPPARRHDVCRAPAAPQPRRDRDPDDHDGPPRRHDVPRNTRVRQLFPGCASDRSVRVQSRSPHPYRRAVGTPELDCTERGRTALRSPRWTPRTRDVVLHAADDWERRRSRSPARRQHCSHLAGCDPLAEAFGGWDSPPVSPPGRDEDPMAMEASLLLAEAPPSAGSLLLARGCGCRSGLSILCTSVCPLAGECTGRGGSVRARGAATAQGRTHWRPDAGRYL